MHAKLFKADGLVVGDAFFMSVIDCFETVVAYSTVELTLGVVADKLVGFVMFETGF